MFRLLVGAMIVAVCGQAYAASASGEGLPELTALTLVVSTERPMPAKTTAEMRQELDKLMRQASIRIEWKQASDLKGGETPNDLVLVKFRGNCQIRPEPIFLDERGPMAYTHVTDGEVLPFSEVLCERVGVAAHSAMSGGEFGRRDVLLGRALARVIAHELYHIKGQAHDHAKEGVAKRALSGRDLIKDSIEFTVADVRRINAHSGTLD